MEKCLACLLRGRTRDIFKGIFTFILAIVVFQLALVFWIIYILLCILLFVWIDICRFHVKNNKNTHV